MNSENTHFLNGQSLTGPFPKGSEVAVFGMGCFWGVERMFWSLDGVHVTAVGYAGGHSDDPDYEKICTGQTGHAEVVRVVFDPMVISYVELLKIFWEGHDPTQGNRQGNDIGTQYRSCIFYADDKQKAAAETSRDAFQLQLSNAGYGKITTEIAPSGKFHLAEGYHQQYLAKNPNGYCGIGGTGVSCPIGLPT